MHSASLQAHHDEPPISERRPRGVSDIAVADQEISTDDAPLSVYLRRRAEEIDACMDKLVPPAHVRPATIHQAIRYSLFSNGKRLRPILTLAAGEALGAPTNALLPVASTMEMIHAGSLIHDDLPAMDDDLLRRGRPTCHAVFGEAVAILAGDALIVRAFHVLAAECHAVTEAQRGRLMVELANATGTVSGLIGGQVADLEAEGVPSDPDSLSYIHNAKTTSLIVASVVAGGIVAGASHAQLALLRRYAKGIGLAFQIIDDILDVTATTEQVGKTTGKDRALGKATFPALYGVEAAHAKAQALVEEAVDHAWRLGVDSRRLEEIARFVAQRLY